MSIPRLSCLLLALALAPLAARAQAAAAPAAAPAPVATAEAPASRFGERRIEHIQHEDAGSRIDELRVGGETQTITVTPKGGMPAYDVLPSSGAQSPSRVERGATGTGGTRVWKVLGF